MFRMSSQIPVAVLLFAWISSATMLIPGPWIAGSWLQWTAKALFVLAGVTVCAVGLRRGRRWLPFVVLLSALSLMYWLSEHLFAIRPMAESFASVAHAIADLDGLPRVVLIQTQLVLPIVHFVCALWLLLSSRAAPQDT